MRRRPRARRLSGEGTTRRCLPPRPRTPIRTRRTPTTTEPGAPTSSASRP
uniref:Uncharacterized protein n=1 Tax=Arundo donax TaxID=35708 RepID=A0A0A9ESQ1_ARUDO